MDEQGVRINKYLSEAGVCSRREADRQIEAGAVTVDGVCARPGTRVLPGQTVCFQGRSVSQEEERILLAFHKPAGIVCTAEKREKNNVIDYIHYPKRIYPVGRLDKDSEGLLLLTNDGALTHRLLSPKSHVDKVYYARTEGTPTEADAARLAQGITLADGLRCLPAELKICGEGQVLLTLREGKFHQAKRMLAFCGTPVVYLKRLSMGPLRLGEDLRPGEFRHLTQEEIDKLQQTVGLVAADCQKNDNNFCKIHKKPLANP